MGVERGDVRLLRLEERKKHEALMRELIEKYLIVRAGVVGGRFVSWKHAKNWLLHSFKLNRTRDTEKMESVKFAGKLYQGNGSAEAPQKTGEKNDESNDTQKDFVEKGDGEKSGSNGEGSKEIMTRTRRKSEEKKKSGS